MGPDLVERMLKNQDPSAYERVQVQKVDQYVREQSELNRQLIINQEPEDTARALQVLRSRTLDKAAVDRAIEGLRNDAQAEEHVAAIDAVQAQASFSGLGMAGGVAVAVLAVVALLGVGLAVGGRSR